MSDDKGIKVDNGVTPPDIDGAPKKKKTVLQAAIIGGGDSGASAMARAALSGKNDSPMVVVVDTPPEPLVREFSADWKPWKGNESDFHQKATSGNYVMVIDTADFAYTAVIKDRRNYEQPKKTREPEYFKEPTTWLTIDDVMDKVNSLIDRGFRPDIEPGYAKVFINNRFRTIAFHPLSGKFLFCDKNGSSYPDKMLDDKFLYQDELESMIGAGKLNAAKLRTEKFPVYDGKTKSLRAEADAPVRPLNEEDNDVSPQPINEEEEIAREFDNFDVVDDDDDGIEDLDERTGNETE